MYGFGVPCLASSGGTELGILRCWRGGGRVAGVRWRMRPFAAADRERVEALWMAAMPPAWPLLMAGVAVLGEGLVAEAGGHLVGFAAVDMAGSIPLILAGPAYQRRGIGAGLLAAAVERVHAGGAVVVTAARGGASCIWPGVPRDPPAVSGSSPRAAGATATTRSTRPRT